MGSAALVLAARGLMRPVRAAETAAALDQSPLIYLTPLRADGRESTCHSEVWFVHLNGEVFVCTQADAWRAEAIRRGLTRATIWVGEFGVWKRAGDRFRAAPTFALTGKLATEPAVQADALRAFGQKYAAEWDKWGPRFRAGLSDGSRVLLRYQVTS
jgi:hypothetical protein